MKNALVLLVIVIVKGLISSGLVAAFRFPPRVALLTGVALAQSAEFSFLLARVGLDVDAVSRPVYDTMLAACVASILLAPALHSVSQPIALRLERWTPYPRRLLHQGDDIDDDGLRGHAVICGYGRVGQVVGEALHRRGFPLLVIEQNPRIARLLRKQGITVLLGSADNQVVLERALVARARVLVVAIPDAMIARRTVDYARRLAPRLDIVARTHSNGERRDAGETRHQ